MAWAQGTGLTKLHLPVRADNH